MHTDRGVTRPSSERVAMKSIVDRQTSVKTLPSPWGRTEQKYMSQVSVCGDDEYDMALSVGNLILSELSIELLTFRGII